MSDWFNRPEYKDVLTYINSVGCQYYFHYLPLDKIGLPVPKYLYLYWDGKSPDRITTEGFTVTIMEDKDAKKCLKSIE